MFCNNGNNCLWIIIILIVLFSCGNSFGCGGSNCGNNCGCECGNNSCC